MAARTTTSLSVMVSLAILALLSLGFFVTTVIFLAQVQRLNRELDTSHTNLAAAIPNDKQSERWDQLKSEFGGGNGVVLGMDAAMDDIAEFVTGRRNDRLSDFEGKASNLDLEVGEGHDSLLVAVQRMYDDREQLKRDLATAQNGMEDARAALTDQQDQLARAREEHSHTIARLTGELDEYQAGVNSYRSDVETAQSDFRSRAASIRADADLSVTGLEQMNRDLESRIQVLERQVQRSRGNDTNRLRPYNEEALVDGTVVDVNPATGQIYLSRGRGDKVPLGITFQVYSIGTAIVPDANGDYPPGKATIEVVNVDPTSSRARVIRGSRGNPILKGDLIANPVYDANKSYSFVVFGNFDVNNDGISTGQETQQIKALIADWGGDLTNDIAGDTDFVVLGNKPILPPEPKFDDPPAIISRYQSLARAQHTYEELFKRAAETSIPVLNQNRLFTLTGLNIDH